MERGVTEKQIREWTYDDPALLARVLDDERGVELEQSDGFGAMRIRIYRAAEMRALGDWLIARADKMEAAYTLFRSQSDRRMVARYGPDWNKRG